jgi:Holliday junction DNA helicase RuvA
MEHSMIASVKGTIAATHPRCIIVVGGVGLEVHVPERDLALLDEGMTEVALFTHLYVREDRLVLYGFLRPEDRELFSRLLSVSGIGPKVALAMLSTHQAGQIITAVQHEDIAVLVAVPGLGRKTAERLVMELKDKLEGLVAEGAAVGRPSTVRDEALLALTALGMARSAAERALESIDWGSMDDPGVEIVVREALKHTGGL